MSTRTYASNLERRRALRLKRSRRNLVTGIAIGTALWLTLSGEAARFLAGPAWQYLDGFLTLVERILRVVGGGS